MRQNVAVMGQAESERRILAAAENVFAADGLAGARTEAIAAAAHVNKALLYYYFGSKQRLHRAVLEHLLRQVFHRMDNAAAQVRSPGDRLLAFTAAYFDFMAAHPNYPRLIQRAWMQSGGLFDWMVKTYFRPLLQSLCRTIEEGIQTREFRKVDPQQMAFTIMSLTGSYFATAPLMSRVFERNVLRPDALAIRKRAMLDFLEHGLFLKSAMKTARSR
jgi:TetR/AcrR family transcriptional regulator